MRGEGGEGKEEKRVIYLDQLPSEKAELGKAAWSFHHIGQYCACESSIIHAVPLI